MQKMARIAQRLAWGLKKFFAFAVNDFAMATHKEVLLEFRRVGAYVKVSAVDPESYTEVHIMGPPSAGREALERVAVQKLRRALSRMGRGR